jgi:hypothetical protein
LSERCTPPFRKLDAFSSRSKPFLEIILMIVGFSFTDEKCIAIYSCKEEKLKLEITNL